MLFQYIISYLLQLEYNNGMDQSNPQLEPKPEPENIHNDEQNNAMASLLAQEGDGIEFPKSGETRDGVIASITPGQILVSVGSKSEGVISGKEFELIPPDELKTLQVGQSIPVYVINPEDSNGNLVLSYVRAREETEWKQAEALLASKASFHSKVIGYNKGGLIVPLGTLRGFIPASQITHTRRTSMEGETPEQKWNKFVGEDIDVCVIEIDRERRRLILSERMASGETRESVRERVMDELKEGEIRSGRVTSLADFGAFVNIGGADGLVHMTEISWDPIKVPGDKLKVGQEVKVKVINIDREKKRIGLSIRLTEKDPWADKVAHYHVGQLVEGKITRLTKFGAFAKLEDDVEGLIHISEISEKRIEHPKESLKEGETLTLRVIKIDPDNHRIGLSVRKVESLAYADQDWETLENMVGGETPATQIENTAESIPAKEEIVEKPLAESEEKKEEPAEKPAEEPAASEEPKPE
jgi:small subunit ribosomal protein S1